MKVVRAAILSGILAVLYMIAAIYVIFGGFGNINANYVGSTISYTSGMPTDICYTNISSYTGSNGHLTIVYPICVEQTTSYTTVGKGHVPMYNDVVLAVTVFATFFALLLLVEKGRRKV